MTVSLIKKIIRFYWSADTVYGVHSPFVYDFFQSVFDTSKRYYLYDHIEHARKELLASSDTMSFEEMGAGSQKSSGASRKVAEVAKNSLSGEWQCRLFFNLVQHFKPNNIIEIGTSLGVSTAYLAGGNSNVDMITLEGNPSSINIAKNLFQRLKLENIEVIQGNFDVTLPALIDRIDNLDMAFIDGNHRKDATISYFNLLKEKANPQSVFIIDDIYWSDGMHEAWSTIQEDPDVAFTIDVFRMGIVFFDHSIMEKQHFRLIEYKYKPWAIGIFSK